ncbi:MAG TPA: class I SAM-dependent methyltransferase [Vicinamibacterales bacterium]|nr:class I SAM-dependent methyltransferase [Vicinamibacterales bacterium]
MTATSQSRDCPVCGGTERRTLFHQEFAAVEQATPVTGYDVVVCERCGCGYADGIPDQRAFDQYYRDMSKYEYAQRGGAESEYDSRRLALIAGIIAPHLPSSGVRILDVGCASGRLLANLRDVGFPNVTGLDPSPACAAAAGRLYGIDVRTMTLGEIAGTGERFEVVIMVGVLEHLRDLDDAFEHLHSLLAPGGLLYVEVPDVTAFADWPNAPYQDFSTEHINFFSPVSLDNLMRARGFRRVFLEQNHREQSYKTVMSNISAIYRREEGPLDGAMPVDRDTAAGLERYLAQCRSDDDRLRAAIGALVDGKRRILVWGVGTHTSRLMATSRLAEADIAAFIESNSRYHGKTLHGRPILAPSALKDHREPVLISSRVFQKEIAEQIRHDLGCGNELILLYNV